MPCGPGKESPLQKNQGISVVQPLYSAVEAVGGRKCRQISSGFNPRIAIITCQPLPLQEMMGMV